MRVRSQPFSAPFLEALARRAALAVLILGLVVLALWWWDTAGFRHAGGDRLRMMANSGILLALLGLALWLVPPQAGNKWSHVRRSVGQFLALLAALLGALTLSEYLFRWDLGIDLMFVPDPYAEKAHAIPGRPSFPTALNAVFLGLGVAWMDVRLRGVWLNELFAIGTLQVSLLGLIGHLFGVPELYGSVPSARGTGMALPGAVGFLVLGAALLSARADRGLVAVFRSRTPGGTMARRLMLTPVVLLLSLGVVYLVLSQKPGLYQAVGTWALFMTSLIGIVVPIWATALLLHRVGLERDEAHNSLEQRVQERTAALNQANEALSSAKEALAQANEHLEQTVRERTLHLNETIRSLETVCYNIAHDLRAPNRTIAGFAQVLLAHHAASLDSHAREYLERIAAAAQKSDALTLDLLDYGRLSHADLPCSTQSLGEHLQVVLQKLALDVTATQAVIQISQPLPNVWANHHALEQVLTNLITNALKFVPKGVRPHLIISATDNGDRCRLLIQDNGIGIPEEHFKSIFGVFQRLHTPEEFPGSGIGLAIVQKSIERMGGAVGVSSSVGNGSCFWFELPKV